MANEPDTRTSTPAEIYIIMGVGALVGLVLLLHPIILVSWWWNPLLEALLEGQRGGVWKPALVLLSVLAGLAILFGCMQPARARVRTDPLLRRIVYGYNAVLTGILVLTMLVIVNVAIQVWAPRHLDATEGGFHSISDVTRTFVTDLERPTHVFVILPDSDALRNLMTLMAQLQELNPRNFTFEYLSPQLNPDRYRDLRKRFPQFNDTGLIVAMGDQPEKNYSFIPSSELTNRNFDERSGQPTSREFAGEVRLMQELNQLSVNKRKTVVYFTQGNGEPDLASPPGNPDGMSVLNLKLIRENYDVRPLKLVGLDPKELKVPEDADVVVVVGPQKSMATALPALEQYLRRPNGRMVAFLGPTTADPTRNNRMIETGMEQMLREYNVEATGDLINMFAVNVSGAVQLVGPDRVHLAAFASALDARQPLAVTFKRAMQWFDCRKIDVSTKNPAYEAMPLFGSAGMVWLETDMQKSAVSQHQLMQRNQGELDRRALIEPQSVAVAVTAPPEGGKPGQARKPKLLVFGSSFLATNQIQERGSGVEGDLIRSSIDWCRERYSGIGVSPKTYHAFVPQKTMSFPRLWVIPSVVMLTAILGLGLVVWNARRR